MTRKFVQLTPVVKAGATGVWLYAIASDGTAWRAHESPSGKLYGSWEQIQELPEATKGVSMLDLSE